MATVFQLHEDMSFCSWNQLTLLLSEAVISPVSIFDSPELVTVLSR